jgi:hypothetical protein
MKNLPSILMLISSLFLIWYSLTGIIKKIKDAKEEISYKYKDVPKIGNVDEIFFEYLKKYFSNEETIIMKDVSLESATLGKLSAEDISPNRRGIKINYLIKTKKTNLAIQLNYNINNSMEESAVKKGTQDYILQGLLRQADILCFNIEINSRRLIPVILDNIKKDFDKMVIEENEEDDNSEE